MHVDHILEAKGCAVHTVQADSPLTTAVAMLDREAIGALVVLGEAGHVVGIISERDIVRYLARDATGLARQPVSRCMSPHLVTTTRHAAIGELMRMMTEHRIRHIPVIEGGELVGLVSIGDVVKMKIAETETEAQALRDYIAS